MFGSVVKRFLDPVIKSYVEREFRDLTSLVMKLTEGNAIELKRDHKYILAFDVAKITKLEIVRLQSAVLKYFGAETIRVAIHGENGLQVIDVTDADGKSAAEPVKQGPSIRKPHDEPLGLGHIQAGSDRSA